MACKDAARKLSEQWYLSGDEHEMLTKYIEGDMNDSNVVCKLTESLISDRRYVYYTVAYAIVCLLIAETYIRSNFSLCTRKIFLVYFLFTLPYVFYELYVVDLETCTGHTIHGNNRTSWYSRLFRKIYPAYDGSTADAGTTIPVDASCKGHSFVYNITNAIIQTAFRPVRYTLIVFVDIIVTIYARIPVYFYIPCTFILSTIGSFVVLVLAKYTIHVPLLFTVRP